MRYKYLFRLIKYSNYVNFFPFFFVTGKFSLTNLCRTSEGECAYFMYYKSFETRQIVTGKITQ